MVENQAGAQAQDQLLNQSIATSFALHNAAIHIPAFDGKSSSLRDFIQAVRNGAALVPAAQTANFLAILLNRLTGPARDSTYGLQFNDIDAFLAHLKHRFAAGQDHAYYVQKISSVQMKQNKSISDLYDHINMLLSSAKAALKEEIPDNQHGNLENMMKTTKLLALNAFIKAMPPTISEHVYAIKPADLAEAKEEAIRWEVAMKANLVPDTRHSGRPISNIPSVPNAHPATYAISSGFNNYYGSPYQHPSPYYYPYNEQPNYPPPHPFGHPTLAPRPNYPNFYQQSGYPYQQYQGSGPNYYRPRNPQYQQPRNYPPFYPRAQFMEGAGTQTTQPPTYQTSTPNWPRNGMHPNPKPTGSRMDNFTTRGMPNIQPQTTTPSNQGQNQSHNRSYNFPQRQPQGQVLNIDQQDAQGPEAQNQTMHMPYRYPMDPQGPPPPEFYEQLYLNNEISMMSQQ